MCDSFAFNDTLDNFTFSASGISFNRSSKSLSSLSPTRTEITANDHSLLNNILIDDSAFISKSICASANIVLNSEDLFLEDSQYIKEKSSNSVLHLQKANLIENSNCELTSWGLPKLILENYTKRGIKTMFSWQVECLSNRKVLQDYCNLIYSAPTSAGKTLVAEMLAIKTIIERKKKVIFILPFVSTVREKTFYFQDILGCSGIRVEGFMGAYNPPGGFKAVQFAICTIEKANSIINRLLEESCLEDLGAVIVDEIHLLGDWSRGYLLELMLTKLQYMTKRYENICIQIIGMSATLPNVDLLGKWLKAELYVTDFRPIPLYEHCLRGSEMYNKSLEMKRTLLPLPELGLDSDNILQLCLETIEASCSTLIFCPTKNWCENLAQQIAVAFWKVGCTKTHYGLVLRQELNSNSIMESIEQLKRCPVGLDKVLEKTVSYGVAFHHAGLTLDERDIIEAAFRNGTLRVLIATSTLSSGVNLPAKRVIIRTPIFHGKPLDSLVYHQMIGRAGRMGRDSDGESILICQTNNFEIAKKLFLSDLEPIESCLEGSGKLKRAILEVVASGVVITPEDVRLFADCTLLAFEQAESDDLLKGPIDDALDFLTRNEFIRLQQLEDGASKYIASSLGKACLSSSMPPEEGLELFAELEKARQCFVLETELHLVYVVTPYNICNQWGNLDWMLFLALWEKLPPSMKRVGELVGVREAYIIGGSRNKIQATTSKLYHKLQVHKRFFTALALQDLVNEVPLNDVATKFGCARGMLQSLQQSASTFAGMLTTFCRQLGWSSVEILISQFQDRLSFGVNRDLLDLMRLSNLNGPRARALYNAGVENLATLATSDICAIENVLRKIGPFESEKERIGESEFDAQKRNKLRAIWVTGREGLTERDAAAMLIEDARRYLQCELGLVEVKWKEESNSNDLPKPKNPDSLIEDKLINEQQVTNDNPENSNSPTKSGIIELNQSVARRVNSPLPPTGSNSENSNTSTKSGIIELNDSADPYSSFELKLSEESFHLRLSNSLETPPIESQIVNTSDSDQSLFDDESFKTNKTKSNLSVKDFNFENDSFLEHAFVSSFGLQTSQDELSGVVCNSQTEAKSIVTLVDISNDSSFFKCKKRDLSKDDVIQSSEDEDDVSLLSGTPKKKRKLFPESQQLDLSKFHIVDVCGDSNVFLKFTSELSRQTKISLSFASKKAVENKPLIGLSIFEKPNVKKQNYCFKSRQVTGFSVSYGKNIVYYVSLEDEAIISNTSKVDFMKSLFSNKSHLVRIFDCKEQLKLAYMCFGFDFLSCFEDPKVSDWLLDPEEKERTLHAMSLRYAPETASFTDLIKDCQGVGSIGLDLLSSAKPYLRSSVESLTTWHLCEYFHGIFQQESHLLKSYEIEMKSLLCVTQMELHGFGVSLTELQSLGDTLKSHTSRIEQQAYSSAGRKFSFTSSSDVAKVLGLYKGRKVATNKQALQQQDTSLSNLILQWRKLNSTLTKMVYPLMRLVENDRIHGNCITHTATGRISMHEPNLQNVPRDFELDDFTTSLKTTISCRLAFVAAENNVLLSADYCQLELRILAHFCQDKLLCSIMKSGQDVFKTVAAKWKNIQESNVDVTQRQCAKQLCYGVIYGMGIKAIATQMSVSEEEANSFLESFHQRYPSIKEYVAATLQKTRELGYVETLCKRRRYLPYINHTNAAIKSQAERQAINTTIQGSAADIAKQAMVFVKERFQTKFRRAENAPKLVLHLHDELLYEVQSKYLNKTAKILKMAMEEVVDLSVPLPVKLKSGPSWGLMQEMILLE